MLINKIKYILTNLLQKFSLERINFSGIFVILFYLIVIVYLGINIFTTFNKGMEDERKFRLEQTRLEELKLENTRLNNELSRYDSIEYKRIYARENLNLAEKNETLYYIERKSPIQEIEVLPEDTVQIDLENNFFWWKKLILGL
jgi:cell division protein FtsB